jgi:ankyrin repeat protein
MSDSDDGVDEVRERLYEILESLVYAGNYLKHNLEEHPELQRILIEKDEELGTLLREHPWLLAVEDEYGGTPVHYLCHHTSHPAVIKLINLRFPDAITETNDVCATPLNMVCGHEDVSCEAIEALTRLYSRALRIPDNDGRTPLHSACEFGASVQVVRLLINKFREALSMKNDMGATPLKTACLRDISDASEKDVYFEVVKLILESYPEALTMGDNDGNTPLHIVFDDQEASKRVLQLFVDRGGAKALKILNNNGDTPLQAACEGGGTFGDVIELMIALYPKALHIANKFGETALHSASFSNVPAETLSVMIDRAPVPCLVLAQDADEDVGFCLPYEWAVEIGRDAHVLELLLHSMKDAASAMMECALSSRIAMSASVTDHVRETASLAMPDFNEGVSIESIRDRLEPGLIKTLVNNIELQELLKKDEAYHCLISGLVRMNKSGRSGARKEPSNILAGLSVLDSISDNVDCIYLHLRENPSLCNRHCGRGRKRKAPDQA